MPLPKSTPDQKNKGKEGKQEFLDKCFHAMKNEKRPQDQKIAICLDIWRRGSEHKKAKGSDETLTWEEMNLG